MLNKVVKNRKSVKNFICLVTKQYLYAQRCLKLPTNFQELKARINGSRSEEQEKTIKLTGITKNGLEKSNCRGKCLKVNANQYSVNTRSIVNIE